MSGRQFNGAKYVRLEALQNLIQYGDRSQVKGGKEKGRGKGGGKLQHGKREDNNISCWHHNSVCLHPT